MCQITILGIDIPDDKKDSINHIVAMAKQHPDYRPGDDDHDIYFELNFGAESVVVTFR